METKKKTVRIAKDVLVPNQGWRHLSLNPEQMKEVFGRVRWFNVGTMEQCLKDVDRIAKLSPTNKVRVAIALFDKLATHSLTGYQEELAYRAHVLRDTARKAGQNNGQSEKQD